MNHYVMLFKSWFEQRNFRERMLALTMSWAIVYAFFSLFLFKPLDSNTQVLVNDIAAAKNQINNWNTQIDALSKIATSPLYKEWLNQHRSFKDLEGQYVFLKNTSSTKQWGDVIKTILQSQNNITLEQVKNFPETVYNPLHLPNMGIKIYQQQLLVVVFSNYFDTLNYLKRLEEVLPNIRWDGIHYQVMQYPVAKVEMEFSILYEKES